MVNLDPSAIDRAQPMHHLPQSDPNKWSALRIAGAYLIAGLLWIGLSDLTLAESGGLTAVGFLVSASKGAGFVLCSAGFVYWLCLREYRNTLQSMTLLRAVVEGTSDAVFVKDLDGKYLFVNSAGAKFVDREVSEVLGRDDSELLSPLEGERLMASDREIMAGGKVVTIEETLTSAGATRTYQSTKAPYFDSAGRVAGLIGISRNVTNRAQVEAALRETDARLREAQRIARLGSWSWEPPTDYVWWSDAEFELFGVEPNEVTPGLKTFMEFLHPEDRPAAIARVEAMWAGADQFANDMRVVRADGSTMWIRSQARATRDAAGKLVRVEGTDQDITAQRLAREALQESERRLQAAIEVAELGIITVDYDQQTVHLSSRAAEQFGIASGATTTRSELHSRFHPEDSDHLNREIDSALDPTGSGWFALEHRVVWPDGTTRWLSVRKQVSFAEGRARGAVLVTADVTDRRKAEARLREQEMLVREAAELAKVGGWGFDPETLQSDWTPEVALMYGLPADAPPAMDDALSFFNPDQRPALEKALAAAMQDGIPHDMELQLNAADGQKRWVRTICRPIVEKGRVVRVRGSLQDITDRKRAESELRASEERYRMLFDSNPHPMWVYDVESLKFLAVNDAAVQAYGYTRDEFLGMTIRDIRPADEVLRLEASVARLGRGLSRSSEWRHRRKDGTVFDVDVSSHDLPEERGHSRLVLALNITDRKRAEAELRASERRLRLALESGGAAAFVYDIPNDLLTRYYSTEPALPVTVARPVALAEVRASIHPDDLPGFEARLSNCLAAGHEYRNEYRVIRNDGTTVHLEDYGYLDRADDGSPLTLTSMVLDVTDRVTANEALRLSEARYRQLVDMLPTAIFVHADNKILYGNPAFLTLIGAKQREDLIGQSPFCIVHSSAHDLLRRRQEELARSRQPLPGCEMLGLRCDGRSIPLYVIAAPVEGYGENATLVALSDLTERERSAALLRSVFDSVDDAILTIDDSGTITSINQSTERLFKYEESELLGTSAYRLIQDPYGDRPDRRDILQNGGDRTMGVDREVKGWRKDGSSFPAELTITEFLRDGQREFTWVLRDITERRQLEEQFRQAQKMEAVGRLAGGVAHDFNNLLTVINGYSELLLAGLGLDDPRQGPLAAIHDAGDRAARLTKQLLALSRKSMVEPQLIDLNELVAESANLFRRLIGEDITLLVLADPVPVRVVLDPGQLEQVLMNLVVNARDAMPAGGRLTIETRTIELNAGLDRSSAELGLARHALLRVTDTGCGIAADVQDKIFEPFFTTKGVGKGTGLGLAVVHGVVQQSGGSIAVESTEGVGTTFKILFPAAADTISDTVSVETHAALQGRETVLVVEDEEAVRTLVRFTLEGQGYSVLTASTGIDAIDLIRMHPGQVDLLVTDMIMPGISGRELAEEARKACQHLRVIYMSGYTDDALSRYGLQGTSDQFIQKPFTPLGLVRKVRSILDQNA